MTKSSQVGDLQLAILRVLWARGEATASDVHAALHAERGLAPTTIATMLKKMEEGRGLVEHREEGRRFIYRPLVTEEELTRSMVTDLKDRMFGGSVSELVGHLLSEHELDRGELAELERLISQAERGRRPKERR